MPIRPAVALVLLLVSQHALAQAHPPANPSALPVRPETPDETLFRQTRGETPPDALTPTSLSANPIWRVPVSNLHPGDVAFSPQIKNPLARDPRAVMRGMQGFNTFNCSGCHAANAGGGMGPALSMGLFTYGSSPANIFLSIYQGRPNGMPAWGAMLPEQTIWELVSYIQSIADHPTRGTTLSRTPQSPSIEQIPAEFLQTPDPWRFTKSFSDGQKPKGE